MRIQISQRAEREIQQAHDGWAENRSANQAARWYQAIYRAIHTLKSSPERHPRIPERHDFEGDLRQPLFGLGRRSTHRIVFRCHSEEVVIITVRHLAQQELAGEV